VEEGLVPKNADIGIIFKTAIRPTANATAFYLETRHFSVREFIGDLRALPQPPLLGLLTGNIRLGAEIKLRHFDLWKLFEIGGFADDHEERDHIAAIAHQRGSQILQQKLPGEQVLVIGDTPLDIRCARAIGAKVLAVATGGHSLEELKRHAPDWAVPDLTLVKASAVCGG